MSTPLSSLTPYCTPQQFIERFDVRTAGDLLSDETPPRRLSSSEVLASTTLADLLMQASGLVESFCMVGERYLPVDLQGLTGASQQLLVGITAGACGGLLMGRRPNILKEPPPSVVFAEKMLERLEQGIAIFGTVEHAAAGLLSSSVDTARDVDTRALTTVIAHRFFGRRSNQLDPRRQ